MCVCKYIFGQIFGPAEPRPRIVRFGVGVRKGSIRIYVTPVRVMPGVALLPGALRSTRVHTWLVGFFLFVFFSMLLLAAGHLLLLFCV